MGRGWRRWATLAVMVGALVAVAGWAYVTDPVRAAKFVSRRLSRQTGAEVRIASVKIGLRGATTLHHVEVRIPGVGGPYGKIFFARAVEVEHRIWGLLGGRFRADRVTLVEPEVFLTQDASTGQYNYELFRAPRGQRPTRQYGAIPEVFVPMGRVRFGEVRGGQYEPLGTLRLSGQLVATEKDRGVFSLRVVEHPEGDPAAEGVRLHGRVDISNATARANIEGLTLEATQRVVLPASIRSAWGELKPRGEIPRVRLGYNIERGLYAECQIRDVRVVSPCPRVAPYVDQINGDFFLSSDGVEILDLTGRWGDLRCEIEGRQLGFGPKQPFELAVRTSPLDIPPRPESVSDLPGWIQRIFERYDPSGTVQGLAFVRREVEDGPVDYHGEVRLRGGRARFHKFPYPLSDIKGLIRFDTKEVRIVKLQGRGPNGATGEMEGKVVLAQGGPGVDLTIQCAQAPIDLPMYDALTVRQGAAIGLFLDQKSLESLVGVGALQTSGKRGDLLEKMSVLRNRRERLSSKVPAGSGSLEELDRQIQETERSLSVPVFDLGGKPSVRVTIHRAQGPDQRATTRIQVGPAGMGVLYRHWPYPIRLVGGELTVEAQRVRVEGIEGMGVTGARIRANGKIDLTRVHGRLEIEPQLKLDIEDLPADPWLQMSVTAKQRGWLEDLGLTGVFDAQVEIFRDTLGEIDYRVAADLTDGAVRPFRAAGGSGDSGDSGGGASGESLVFSDLRGSFALGPGRLAIEQLQGALDGCGVGFSGRIEWAGERDQVDLDVSFEGMHVDPALWKCLPEVDAGRWGGELARLIEQYRVSGLWDGRLLYTRSPGESQRFSLEIRPKELRLEQDGQAVVLGSFTGSALVTPGRVALNGLGASFGDESFEVNGCLTLGPDPEVDLTLSARGQRIGTVTRAVLPVAVRAAIDGLSFDGAYEVDGARITRRGESPSGGWAVEGRVRLDDARAVVGVALDQIQGVLEFKASGTSGSPWPTLDLALDAQRLRAGGRPMQSLLFHLSSGEDPQQIVVRDLRGQCAGGTLLGSGDITLGSGGRYRLNLTLQNANLRSFVHPGPNQSGSSEGAAPIATDNSPREEGGDSASGVLSASLWIEGLLQDPKSKRGRGELEIRDARLYELPVALATIQMLNLSLPASRSFDRATVTYLLEDDLVRLEQIRFYAPTIEIAGSGTMVFSSGALDLDMFTRNPVGPDLGPVSDLVKVFKDELIRIRVTGTLGKPEPKFASLEGIKKSWQEVFGEESVAQPPPP